MSLSIIAEIAQAHDGSLGTAHAMIDALAGTGVTTVKFQTHLADAESSEFEPFRVKFSKQDKTRFDYWKRMEFSLAQWKELKEHCEEKGLEFMSSPFSNAAVDLLEEVGVKRYKVGSGEVNNRLLLEKIGRTGKPVLLSSGMSSFDELDESVRFLRNFGNELAVFQCTTAYPVPPDRWGLNVLAELKSRYGLPVGYSDHSGDVFACLAAATLGAELFEFHVVFDKRQFGPDTSSSVTMEQTALICRGIRQIREACGSPALKSDNSGFKDLKAIFEKSLALNCSLPAGHVLRFEDLEAKKPKGYGLDAARFEEVIGRKLNKPLSRWSFLREEDLTD